MARWLMQVEGCPCVPSPSIPPRMESNRILGEAKNVQCPDFLRHVGAESSRAHVVRCRAWELLDPHGHVLLGGESECTRRVWVPE